MHHFLVVLQKFYGTVIDNAKDLHIVMPMYNLLYYCKNYKNTSGSLFNYYRDEQNSGYNNDNRDRIHYSIKDSDSFNYKTSIIGKLENNEMN